MTYDVQPASPTQLDPLIETTQGDPVVAGPHKRSRPGDSLRQLAGHLTTVASKAGTLSVAPQADDSGMPVGFIDNADGAQVRAEPGGKVVGKLPPGTRVVLGPAHIDAAGWRHVTAAVVNEAAGSVTIVRGCVKTSLIMTTAPEPAAVLYRVAAGDTAQKLVAKYYSGFTRPGHDLRYFENVMLRVNQEQGRKGVQGTNPQDIRLVQGELIWLVSPAYAAKLEPLVDSGSYTGGKFAEAKHTYADYRSRIDDVVSSMRVSKHVGREYADYLQANQNQIVGAIMVLFLADMMSWGFANSPVLPLKIAGLVIQVVLLYFGAKATYDSMQKAEHHCGAWLDKAWHADHKPEALTAASEQFTHMLVEVLLFLASLGYTVGKVMIMPGFKIPLAELKAGLGFGPPGFGMRLGPRPGDIDANSGRSLLDGPRASEPAPEGLGPSELVPSELVPANWGVLAQVPWSQRIASLPVGIPFAFGGGSFSPQERAAHAAEGYLPRDVLDAVDASRAKVHGLSDKELESAADSILPWLMAQKGHIPRLEKTAAELIANFHQGKRAMFELLSHMVSDLPAQPAQAKTAFGILTELYERLLRGNYKNAPEAIPPGQRQISHAQIFDALREVTGRRQDLRRLDDESLLIALSIACKQAASSHTTEAALELAQQLWLQPQRLAEEIASRTPAGGIDYHVFSVVNSAQALDAALNVWLNITAVFVEFQSRVQTPAFRDYAGPKLTEPSGSGAAKNQAFSSDRYKQGELQTPQQIQIRCREIQTAVDGLSPEQVVDALLAYKKSESFSHTIQSRLDNLKEAVADQIEAHLESQLPPKPVDLTAMALGLPPGMAAPGATSGFRLPVQEIPLDLSLLKGRRGPLDDIQGNVFGQAVPDFASPKFLNVIAALAPAFTTDRFIDIAIVWSLAGRLKAFITNEATRKAVVDYVK